MADFFCADADECDEDARRARAELQELRAMTLLAVAQARRTELELREALGEGQPDDRRLAYLVPRLEEERARAEALVRRFREREQAEEDRLMRLGTVRAARELNRRRQHLHTALDRASRAADEQELVQLEDEARAEAHRLDVLVALNEGEDLPPMRAPTLRAEEDLRARARRLLEQSDED